MMSLLAPPYLLWVFLLSIGQPDHFCYCMAASTVHLQPQASWAKAQ